MKKAQIPFGTDKQVKTFGGNQGAIYSANKSNKINNSLLIYKIIDEDYYKETPLYNKRLMIGNTIAIRSNGNFTSNVD